MAERMPCSITDGPQYDDDIPPIAQERDEPTHEEREDWIRHRDECLQTALRIRLDAAIRDLENLGLMPFNDVLRLLKDCQREIGEPTIAEVAEQLGS